MTDNAGTEIRRQMFGDIATEHTPARIGVAIFPDGVDVALEFATAGQPASKMLRIVGSHAHSDSRYIDPVRRLLAGVGKAAAKQGSRLDHRNGNAFRPMGPRQVPGHRRAGKTAADYGDTQPMGRRERVHEALASDFGRWSPAMVSPNGPVLTDEAADLTG